MIPPARDTPSGTGLRPSTASALAYLVGPLSGALVLLAEGRNEAVRFHAWQSILALGGLWIAGMLCYVFAFGALFLSGAATPLFLWLSTLVWLVWVIVWLVCLWKAWAGARLELPYVGRLAARLARTPDV
ncbi:MAG TPA: hypothetical protein VFX12_15820 [Vicinamibacterales bacterium]|nr:hypothetical protein [Vicinamibacterales bacterium]